ncbi:hypothetical protein [Pedococcus soli]
MSNFIRRGLDRFGRLDHAFKNAASTEAGAADDSFTPMTLPGFEGIVAQA